MTIWIPLGMKLHVPGLGSIVPNQLHDGSEGPLQDLLVGMEEFPRAVPLHRETDETRGHLANLNVAVSAGE